jgi:hypothetical protein
MRRITLVLAALAIVVSTIAAFSVPAIAQNDPNCSDAWGNWISCDGQLYSPADDSWDNGWNNTPVDNSWGNGWDNGWGWDNQNNDGWSWEEWQAAQECPYWGDFEGPINQGDCFD